MTREDFKTIEAAATQSGAMESGDHFKNRTSLKSHTSRGNKMNVFAIAIFLATTIMMFSGCKKDDDAATKGRKAAIELCDCLEKAGTLSEIETCVGNFANKYVKYKDNEEFENAAEAELEKCSFEN